MERKGAFFWNDPLVHCFFLVAVATTTHTRSPVVFVILNVMGFSFLLAIALLTNGAVPRSLSKV